MKAKKANKAKRYEIDMLEIAEELVGKTSFFSSIPFSELELSERQKHTTVDPFLTLKIEI